ncbi:MAG: DNA methyltransferase [Candidatus Paceibacterota bacterium]
MVLARKPLEESTVAKNVLKYGTGGLNIDESRIKSNESSRKFKGRGFASQNQTNKEQGFRPKNYYENQDGFEYESHSKGRFPSNVIHDGSPEVLELLPESNSTRINNINNPKSRKNNQPTSYDLGKNNEETIDHRDSGTSARFFYCAKASVSDREEGLEKLLEKLQAASEFRPNHMEKTLNGESGNPYGRFKKRKNNHPTVKPTALMRYLCKLITPKDGTVLDPFMGSGSTGKACGLEDFNFIGIELDSDYFEIAKLRIEHAYNKEEINNLEKYFN